MTIQELIEWLQTLPTDAEICITDIDDDQEFVLFGIARSSDEKTVDFVIEKKEEEESTDGSDK